MATMSKFTTDRPQYSDALTGTERARGLDRWIFVITAALYIAIVLTGFIPDSLMKIELVRAGQRPPFPWILHAHSVLMGGFLLFLLAQTYWAATGNVERHMKWGRLGGVIAAALVVVGFILVPTNYHQVWDGLQTAPPEAQVRLQGINRNQENLLLLQTRAGLLFSLFIVIGLIARHSDSGLHKRMMMLAPAMAISAAFARIKWIPDSMPESPLSATLYPLLAIAPLFLWDVYRNGRVHRAYWIMFAAYVPLSLWVQYAWDTPWWHATARHIMGV